MPDPRTLMLQRWKLPVRRLPESEFLTLEDLPSAIYLIDRGPFQIPILIRRTESTTGLFAFHGAKDRHKFTPPIFEGAGVSGQLGINAILHSDPILDASKEVTIGWFAGTSSLPLQEILSGYQQRIAEVLRLRTRVYFGGSGGGFAALFYGLKASAEIVLAMSPQTIISHHNPVAVRRYFQTGFGVESETGVPATIRSRYCWDIRKVWPTTLRSRVVYLQNSGDERHMDRHLKPLQEYAERNLILETASGPGLCVVLRHWADDHSPPPKTLVMDQLRRVVPS